MKNKNKKQPAKIITFYSYKGGSGRSQLAANLAAYLCHYENKKILLIDWDLEAPGLDYFFGFDRTKISKGLIEVFEEFVKVSKSDTQEEEKVTVADKKKSKKVSTSDIHLDLPVIEHFYSLVHSKKGGKIDLVPAANYNTKDFTHRINSFDWFEFYDILEGRYYIEYLKEKLKESDYDFIFIDSRTGLSDYLGICNIQIPDVNIIVVAPTKQNIEGAEKIINLISESNYTKQNRPDPIILPVLSRLDPTENELATEWRSKFTTAFKQTIESTLSALNHYTKIENYLRQTPIDYVLELAYGEKVLFSENKNEIATDSIQEKFVNIWRYTEQKEKEKDYNYFVDYNEVTIPRLLTNPPFNADLFIGRDNDLNAIETQYQAHNRLLVLVNGEGGIGKTALAAKYWYAHADRYQHLAWLYADAGIGAALVTLKAVLGVDFEPTDDLETQVRRIVEAINNLEKPCLLILDNANNPADLKKYYTPLHQLPNCHILLTSRVSQVAHMPVHKVLPLTPTEAVHLFKTYYHDLPDTDLPILHDVLKAVGYNTLVMEVLAKNMAVFNRFAVRYALGDLLRDLQEKGLLALKNKAVAVVYGSDQLREAEPTDIIAAMYDLSDLSDAERHVLSNLAVLPAENIAYTLLTTLLETDEEVLEQALGNLETKGWLEYRKTDNSFKVSPVIQEVTRRKNAERLLDDCRPLVNTLITGLNNDNRHTNNYQQSTVFAHLGAAVIYALPIHVDIATLCQNIGNYHKDTGNLNAMMQAYQKMLDIQTALCAAEPDNAHFKNGLAISYSKLGETHSSLGNLDRALSFFEQSNKLHQGLYAAYPQNVEFKNRLAISYKGLGDTHSSLGNLDKALEFVEEYNRIEKELYDDYPQNVDFKNELANSYGQLGGIYTALGDLEKALPTFEETKKLFKELYECYPQNVSFKNGLAISYSRLGNTHSSLGNLDKALEVFEKMTRLFEELYTAYPQNVSFKNGLAISYAKLGETHSRLGNLDKVLEFFEEYNRLEKELYAAYPQNVAFKNGLAVSYSKLGETHSSLGNLDKALEVFEKDIELSKELYDAYPQNVAFKNSLAISYAKLGGTHSSLGNLDKALEFFEKYNQLEKELYDAYPQNVAFKNGLAISCQSLGNTHRSLGNLDKALEFFEKAIELSKELYAAYPQNVKFKNGLAISYYKLAEIGNAQKDKKKAKTYFQDAEKLWLELVRDAPQYVQFQEFLGIVQEDIKALE